MDLFLKDKVVVVTGGSRGLGYACAESIAAEGALVCIVSRSEENLADAAGRIESSTGSRPHVFPADLSSQGDIAALFGHVMKIHKTVDGLLINSGGPPPGAALEMTEAEWESAINTNLLSAVRLCRAFIPVMREKKYGRIVAITSSSARQPIENLVLSNTTRIGVLGFLKTLANEVARDNVLVNSLLPGPINTERLRELTEKQAKNLNLYPKDLEKARVSAIPLGRIGEPGELAALAAFLISGRNGFVTGQAITVDGGFVRGVL